MNYRFLRVVFFFAVDFLRVVDLRAGLRAVDFFFAVVFFFAAFLTVFFFTVFLATFLRVVVFFLAVLLRAGLRATFLRVVFFAAVFRRTVLAFLAAAMKELFYYNLFAYDNFDQIILMTKNIFFKVVTKYLYYRLQKKY